LVSRNLIEQVLGRTAIEDVVGEHVELRRSGSSYKGLCPFHEESAPSFYVHPDRGFYYCFGCRKGGDAIRFIQEMEGSTFMEALVELAGRVGVDIPPEELGRRRESGDEARRDRQLKLLEATARLFERTLANHPEGARARDYLEGRGIASETVERFRLGFAPDRWDFLVEHLRSSRVSPQDAVDVGLIRPRKRGDGYYDWFRNRLVFPITSPGGKVIGFSGRLVPSAGGEEGQEAKYLNTQETPYYRKGEVIYGLWQASQAIRRSGRVYLVEGNFDLVAMSQAGFENVVAPMGTAITAEQARRLSRYRAELVFVFDGDRAGRAAAVKAFEVVAPSGAPARVALLPSGEDPDSLLRSRGADALEEVLSRAGEMGEFVIRHAAGASGDSAGRKVESIRELWRVLCRVSDPMLRDIYLKRMAGEFEIDEAIVRRHVGLGGGRPAPSAPSEPDGRDDTTVQAAAEVRELVGALLDQPSLAARLAGAVDELELGHEGLAGVVRQLSGPDPEAAVKNLRETLTTEHGEPYKRWALERLVRPRYATLEAAEEAFADCRSRIMRKMHERRLQELSGEIRSAIERGDRDKLEILTREKIRLTRLRVAADPLDGEPAA
jgi:DNA primase